MCTSMTNASHKSASTSVRQSATAGSNGKQQQEQQPLLLPVQDIVRLLWLFNNSKRKIRVFLWLRQCHYDGGSSAKRKIPGAGHFCLELPATLEHNVLRWKD